MELKVETGEYPLIRNVRDVIESPDGQVTVERVRETDGEITGEIACTLGKLTADEKQILLDGCLINYYRR